MRLWSDSFENARPIPAEFAMGQPEGFAPNRNGGNQGFLRKSR